MSEGSKQGKSGAGLRLSRYVGPRFVWFVGRQGEDGSDRKELGLT